MATILEAIKAKDENADGDTIAKALGGGGTIATALLGDADSGDEGYTPDKDLAGGGPPSAETGAV